VPPIALVGHAAPESSAVVASRIAAARRRQASRGTGRVNGQLSGRALRAACALDAITERLLRVARTIADLEGADRVVAAHLDEAARFRTPARSLADQLAS